MFLATALGLLAGFTSPATADSVEVTASVSGDLEPGGVLSAEAQVTVEPGITIEGYLSKTEVRAAKLADGTELWKRVLGGVVDSSALLIGDKLVVGCHDGNLHLITAADGKVVQSVPLGPKVYSSPAWSDGKIYIGSNDGLLHCLR